MRLRLTYGTKQQFKYRTRDINLVGRVLEVKYPLKRSHYHLNSQDPIHFRVEDVPDPGIDWTYEYKDSPAVNRLKDLGDFNIEIPVAESELKEGDNRLVIELEDAEGDKVSETVHFSWDPAPLPVELDLSDLTKYSSIQEVGQVVNGAFDVDPILNLIRSRAPVYPDALCVIGSPHGSQEAVYNVRFTDLTKVKWLGPSDYFVGNEGPDPPIGIKPGWSTVGMANIDPRWKARSFIAFGDHVGTDSEWVVQTCPPNRFESEADVLYTIRHQVILENGSDRVRYRVWPAAEPEPKEWLCDESDVDIPASKPRFSAGSFSLFQHSGFPIEWSNIRVRPM